MTKLYQIKFYKISIVQVARCRIDRRCQTDLAKIDDVMDTSLKVSIGYHKIVLPYYANTVGHRCNNPAQ